MLTTILFIGSAVAQAYGAPPATPAPAVRATTPAPVVAPSAAIPGRTLKDLPATTITYYDVAGTTAPAIEKSLKKMSASATKDALRPLTWDVQTQLTKATEGAKCTIQGVKTTLVAKVRLPRLTEEAKVPQDVLANWRTYVAAVEGEAAANLWFLSDRLRGAEQSLVGMPCDQASPAWDAKFEAVKTDLKAFVAQRAKAAPKPAA